MKRLEAAMIVGRMVGGGVETIILSYLRHIDKEKIHFTCIIDDDSTYVPVKEITESGAELVYVPSYKHQPAYQRALRELFEARRFDIVHSHINTLSVFPLCAAKRAGIPVRIAHSHSTAGRGEPVKNLIKFALRPLSRVFPTELCACGEYAGRWLFGKNADFTVLPNNLDFEAEKYFFDAAARERVRRELGIEDKLAVGHVGRFIPQKNHSFLLMIFAELLKRRPDAVLLLAGDGELRESTEAQAERLGIGDKILFLGQTENVIQLYQAMDIFVLPSLYEGKPLSAMEAQYASLPVLLSDRISEETALFRNMVKYESLESRPEKWAEDIIAMAEARAVRVPVKAKLHDYASNHVSPEGLSDWYIGLARKHESTAR